MNWRTLIYVGSFTVIVGLSSACGRFFPPGTPTPPPAVQTPAATQTAIANQSATAVATTSVTPTPTATATTVPSATPTATSIPSTATPTATTIPATPTVVSTPPAASPTSVLPPPAVPTTAPSVPTAAPAAPTSVPAVPTTSVPPPPPAAPTTSPGAAPAPAGFPRTQQEFWQAVYRPCQPTDADCLPLEVSEIGPCPAEPFGSCWRALREKNQFAQIRPFRGVNPIDCGVQAPDFAWWRDGWLHNKSDRDTLGRPTPPWPETARGSGIPFGRELVIEGMTVRACNGTTTPNGSPYAGPIVTQGQASPPAPSAPAPGAPAPDPGVDMANPDSVRSFLKITDSAVNFGNCPGEPAGSCWSITKRVGNTPQRFKMTNPLNKRIDGVLANNQTGIPAGYDGEVLGTTIRVADVAP